MNIAPNYRITSISVNTNQEIENLEINHQKVELLPTFLRAYNDGHDYVVYALKDDLKVGDYLLQAEGGIEGTLEKTPAPITAINGDTITLGEGDQTWEYTRDIEKDVDLI